MTRARLPGMWDKLRRSRWRVGALGCLVFATASAAALGAERPNDRLKDRDTLIAALLKARVFHKDRQLVHMSHVCDLRLKGSNFPVVDVRELVPGASTARGVNRIVVLNDKLAPVKTIAYTTERPLFCDGTKLFVFGDLSLGAGAEGNVLEFVGDGRTVRVQHIEVNKLPAPTGATLGSGQ